MAALPGWLDLAEPGQFIGERLIHELARRPDAFRGQRNLLRIFREARIVTRLETFLRIGPPNG
jgi:hypothetical protein